MSDFIIPETVTTISREAFCGCAALTSIKIPKYVSEGDFIIDLYIHRPLVQDYMYAPKCCLIHFEGNYSGLGRPLIGRNDGFMGLESIDI